MSSVAVIGAGIAGLTSALRLSEMGHEVTLFEASRYAGGVIRSERTGGYLVEHGPNSVQTRTEALERLIDEIGLAGDVVEAAPQALRRYVVRGGTPLPLPSSPLTLFNSELFSWRAKLALLQEPFAAAADAEAEESVARFVQRRLGSEWLEYAADPFVAGVFAGDPARLSMRHAFPRVYELEQSHGSLFKGLLGRARRRGSSPRSARRMFSFRDGLAMLPAALARRLGTRLRLGAAVVRMAPSTTGVTLSIEENGREEVRRFDAAVSAVPLYTLARLVPREGFNTELLSGVRYAGVRVVALGYRRDAVAHPLDGFGLLVPAVEARFQLLGILFTSSLFPERAPEGHVLLTVFVGGSRRPELAVAGTAYIESLIQADLRQLLGVSGPPAFVRHVSWPEAIPQYEVGYGRVLRHLDDLEEQIPALAFAGSYRSGISVGDAAASGEAAALRIGERLRR